MRKYLKLGICTGLITIFNFRFSTCQAQWWTGWSRQTSLALCIHMDGDNLQLYSPLQSQDPIAVSQWSLRSDTLRIECKSIGFRATLARKGDQWQGTWRQGLMREKITFDPADTLYQLRRPQTPLKPYRFEEETIAVDYVDRRGDSIHLEGTLTYPKGGGRFPTLVLVSGSGQQNRDEELYLHKPFLVLADYLASRGIATLRYDDRGVGDSRGPLDSATTHTFGEDAEAMLMAAGKNKHVDAKRLGIGGHSEGGAIAPMVAARNGAARYVVMLAGLGTTGLELLVQQNEALFRTRGVSERLCQVRAECMREVFALPQGSDWKDFQAVILRHTAGLTEAQIDSIELKKGMAYAMQQQMATPWMQAFMRLDPASYLPKVKVPMLVLQGLKDRQVPAMANLMEINRLTEGRAKNEVFAGLNHLFQHCQTGDVYEYVQIEETFAPEAMEKIANFILNLTH